MKRRRRLEISLVLSAACAFLTTAAFWQVQRPNKSAFRARVGTSTDWPGWGAAAWAGTQEGIRAWQLQARLVGVRINGSVATGGKLVGPGIETSIRSRMRIAGAPSATARKSAAAVSDAWRLWHEGIVLRVVAWYPAFAAWPGAPVSFSFSSRTGAENE